MKAKCQWNAGNYNVTLETGELTPETAQVLMNLGLLQCGQRNSDFDKIIGLAVKDAKGVYRRVAGKTRMDFDYDAAKAAELAVSFGAIATPKDYGAIELKPSATVSQAIRDVVESKFVVEREAMARHESLTATTGPVEDLALEPWLVAIGYDVRDENGDLVTHGEDGEFAIGALQVVRQRRRTLKF
jgi:hypothetical protein